MDHVSTPPKKKQIVQYWQSASSEGSPQKQWKLSPYSLPGVPFFLSQVRRVCTALLCIRKNVARIFFFNLRRVGFTQRTKTPCKAGRSECLQIPMESQKVGVEPWSKNHFEK